MYICRGAAVYVDENGSAVAKCVYNNSYIFILYGTLLAKSSQGNAVVQLQRFIPWELFPWRTFGPIQNIPETLVPCQMAFDIRSCQNVHTQNYPWFQSARNAYFYFWFTGFVHEKYRYVSLVQQLCCGCIANNSPPALVAWLIMAHGS